MSEYDERFVALEGVDNPEEYITCIYKFQTHLKDIKEAAIQLCKSQSTSSAGWGDVGAVEGETKEITDRFGAKLLSYESIEESDTPDLPLVSPDMKSDKYTRVMTKIAIPVRNFGESIPALLTAAAGEIHYLDQFNSIKLEDIEFPKPYLDTFRGPRSGPEGLRHLLGIKEVRPIVIGVIKPSLCPSDMFADLAYKSALGGADVVKDDELLSDIPDSRLIQRVRAVIKGLDKAEKETGKRTIYQVNITSDVSKLKRNYSMAIAAGAESIMVNAMAIGLSAARMVTDFSDVPVCSHFDLTGCNAKVPFHGVSHKLLAKLHRMAGIDNLVIPSPKSVLMEYPTDIDNEIKSCQEPLGNLKQSMPFLGGGNRADNMARILDAAGTSNVGYIVGHGIYSHPDGPEAGTKSIIQAWEAYKDGIDIKEYAKKHPELKKAIEYFGTHFD